MQTKVWIQDLNKNDFLVFSKSDAEMCMVTGILFQGEVITFLDAHCECTEGWLEPLLARIVQNRRTVVCPIIDVISDETFEYITASDSTWGGFNWKLNFRW